MPEEPLDPTSDAHARRVLESVQTIAILGAHPQRSRAAFYVPDYLASVGYRVLPVNPRHAGEELFGATTVARLDALDEPIDLVDVFRRSDAVVDHVDEVLAMRPLPKVVWLQLGITSPEAAARWRSAGIDVVQNRCTLADHRRLLA
jgi:predicted CoA-binding protein